MGRAGKITASFAALFMSAGTATAADWTVYLGGLGGYAWFDKDWDAYSQGTTNPTYLSHEVSFSGDLYGIEGGLRFTAGPLALGVEASWARLNAAGEFSFFDPNPPFNSSCAAPGPCRTTVHSIATLTGQVGRAMGPVLVYGEFGAALARENFFYDYGGAQVDFDFTNYGWVAGAGIVLASQSGLYFKAEYNYMDFGGPEFFGNGGGADFWLTQSAHVVTLGVGIGF